MTKLRRRFVRVICVLLICSPVVAQQATPKPLTNADVVSMVKAGLSESTVVLTVQRSPASFDLSPQALIELKNQGVPQKILDAMLTARALGFQATPKEEVTSSGSVPGLPTEQGLYYKGPAGFVKLEPATASQARTKGAKKFVLTMGLSDLQLVNAYRGAHAPVQITEARPVFYLRAPAEMSVRDVQIVRLDTKKDRREIQVTSGSLNVQIGYREKDLRGTRVTRLSAGLYEIAPEAELASGEYLLEFGPLGAYDFGISSSK